MAGMGDIGELLGSDNGLVDESTLPDAGSEEALDMGAGPADAPAEQPPAGDPDPYAGRKQVPLGALQEERARRQELQQQLQQQSEHNQRLQDRFNQFMERWQQSQQPAAQPQPQQPEPVQIPNFIDDPEGHIAALRQQFQQQLDEVRQYQQGTIQQQQATQQGQRLAQHTAAQEAEFVKTTPDYQNAADFFAQRKLAEYAALGADPVSAQQALMRDYQSLAIGAAQRGGNAAQMLYNLAKAMGYAGAAPAAPGKAPAAPPAVQAPKQAPTSLAGLGGAPVTPGETGALTLESLAEMSDAEFDKLFAQMERGSRQRPKI